MSAVIVSDSAAPWLAAGIGSDYRVVTPHAYLSEAACRQAARVFNLCESLDYQGLGYYVSLLAQARGQSPLPEVKTLDDLQSDALVRQLMAPLDALLQDEMSHFGDGANEFHELCLIFGREPCGRIPRLGTEIFSRLPAPLLRVRLQRRGKPDRHWSLQSVRPFGPSELRQSERLSLLQALAHWRQPAPRAPQSHAGHGAPRLAILYDPKSAEPPSNAAAIAGFCDAAATLGMRADIITRHDAAHLGEFDALFLRETTSVTDHTYQLARRAAAGGLVVLDDPDSIIQCTNKIYLAELLARHGVPTPRSMVVHHGNIDRVAPTLGLPCTLKQPDGAFSLGVVKVANETALHDAAQRLLRGSALILAQEYVPTAFDWRIGVLDRQPLFACQYFMASGHWQIIKRRQQVKLCEGRTQALPLAQVPPMVLDTALAAAGLIGDGLYGVDLKQCGRRCYVIEINDNPNLDAGHEDGVLHEALYRQVMQVFRHRIDHRDRSFP